MAMSALRRRLTLFAGGIACALLFGSQGYASDVEVRVGRDQFNPDWGAVFPADLAAT